MPLSANMRGSLFMVIAMAGFTVNDALTKIAGAQMNPGQLMFVRGLFAIALVGFLVWQQKAWCPPRTILTPTFGLRIFAELGATLCFLIALQSLPLANATAIMQALPLTITMAAALFLNEPVGWRRWSAVAAGFIGVLIIVRPGLEGFNSSAIYALVAVGFCTLRDLATSRIPKSVPSLFIALTTSCVITLGGLLVVLPFGGWVPMEGAMVGLLSLSAVMVLIGYQFVAMAVRTSEMSAVAPFRYTALIWSILLTIILFGQYPDTPMLIGASIIVLSGMYAFWRERRAGRLKPAATTTSPAMAPDGM